MKVEDLRPRGAAWAIRLHEAATADDQCELLGPVATRRALPRTAKLGRARALVRGHFLSVLERTAV